MKRFVGTPYCTLAEVGRTPNGQVWVLCGCGWHMTGQRSVRSARMAHKEHIGRVLTSVRQVRA